MNDGGWRGPEVYKGGQDLGKVTLAKGIEVRDRNFKYVQHFVQNLHPREQFCFSHTLKLIKQYRKVLKVEKLRIKSNPAITFIKKSMNLILWGGGRQLV